jgi:hypothetical protein
MTSNQSDHSPNTIPLQASNKTPFAFGYKTGRSQLEGNFQPCLYSVICGRGHDIFKYVGNCRFRILTSSFLQSYSRAGGIKSANSAKSAKSAIVSDIVATIRHAGGNFCKYEKGAWFEVGDHCAREKVSTLLREMLHDRKPIKKQNQQCDQRPVHSPLLRKMQISAKARLSQQGLRKLNKKQNQQCDQQLVQGTEHSDDSSTASTSSTSSSASADWGRDSLGSQYLPDDVFFDIEFVF